MEQEEMLTTWVAVWEAEEHAPDGWQPVVARLRRLAEMCGPEPPRPPQWEYDRLLERVRDDGGRSP